MKPVLVKPCEMYIDEICAYRRESLEYDKWIHGSGGLSQFEDINAWITQCRLSERKETVPNPDWVESEQFVLVCEDGRRILGMINFRHYLNELIAERGGHIGYSVRPIERRRGYAKAMLMLCLEKCREFGTDKVLLTCDFDNEASRRTIISCGGKFERLADSEDGKKDTERYWIVLQ